MTDNQEKELFNTLATLVTGVNAIQSDIKEIRETQTEHSGILKEHTGILKEHSRTLNEHSRILTKLDAKTDIIAEKVMNNDKRLTAVEKDAADLRGGIH